MTVSCVLFHFISGEKQAIPNGLSILLTERQTITCRRQQSHGSVHCPIWQSCAYLVRVIITFKHVQTSSLPVPLARGRGREGRGSPIPPLPNLHRIRAGSIPAESRRSRDTSWAWNQRRFKPDVINISCFRRRKSLIENLSTTRNRCYGVRNWLYAIQFSAYVTTLKRFAVRKLTLFSMIQ